MLYALLIAIHLHIGQSYFRILSFGRLAAFRTSLAPSLRYATLRFLHTVEIAEASSIEERAF